MLPHLSLFPFISLLLVLVILLVELPFSFSESGFSNCSCSTFECGAITNITYPFWGNDIPYYCGYSDDFELKCRHNSTEILIGSLNYRVLNISLLTNTIRIAPIGIWTDNCPSSFLDFSLPRDTFLPSFNGGIPSIRTLDLYYGCPLIPQLTPTNVFNCSSNKIVGMNYFWDDDYSPDDLSKCVATVPIIVPAISVQSFTSHQSTVEEVLSNGFQVSYRTTRDDESNFSRCSRSTYECGAITNITYPFWGNDMPYYCGYSGDFRLKCRDNSTEILIGSLNYRVLNISLLAKTFWIAPPIGIWTDNCPSTFLDFSLPPGTFQTSSNDNIPSFHTLTLYYGCPSIPQLTPTNVFNCSSNKTVGINYFWVHDYSTNLAHPDNLSRCDVSVTIIVPTTSVKRFTSHQSTVEEILSNGVEVGYYLGESLSNGFDVGHRVANIRNIAIGFKME